MTTNSGKLLDEKNYAQNVSLMCEIKNSVKDSNDLSTGFHRDRDMKERVLTNNKNGKRENHVKITLREIFCFAGHQEKATYGWGYILTLNMNSKNAMLSKTETITHAKNVIIFAQ